MEYMHKIKLETEVETYRLDGYSFRPKLKLVFYKRASSDHFWELLYKHDITYCESIEEIQKILDEIWTQLPNIQKPCEEFEF